MSNSVCVSLGKYAQIPSYPIRILLIGLGSRGLGNFFPALTSAECRAFSLTAACDVSVERIGKLQELLRQRRKKNVMVHTDIGAIPVDRYDMAVIAAPHDQHLHIVRQLASEFKILMKEKPFARNVLEADEMFDLCPQVRTLTDRRYFKTSLLVKGLIREVGTVRRFVAISCLPSPNYSQSWRNDPVRAGGGAIIDLGYHLIDLSITILGPPVLVHARERATRRQGYNVEEDVEMYLKSSQGVAHLWANRTGARRKEYFEVQGDHGKIRWSRTTVRFQQKRDVYFWRVNDTYDQCLRRMISHEVSFALNGRPSSEHAMTVQATIESLYKSLVKGPTELSIGRTRSTNRR